MGDSARDYRNCPAKYGLMGDDRDAELRQGNAELRTSVFVVVVVFPKRQYL